MNQIYQVNKDFDFSKLTLANPNGLQGGAYFTKLKMDNGPLYIQMPRSLSKQGIVKTEKKMYCDLLFTNDDTEVIEWILGLEERIQDIIYEKRNLWFQSDLDLDDIQSSFNSSLRSYKGNKCLIRTNIVTPKHINYRPNIQIFDEDEKEKSVEEITGSSPIITILEVTGVRFTSRNFQLELVLKQIMMLENKPIFNNCLFKRADKTGQENKVEEGLKIPITKNSDKDKTLEKDEDLETFSDSSVDDTVSKTENVNAGSEVVKVETIEESDKTEESQSVSVDKDDSVSVKDDVATINDTNENIETDIVNTAQDNSGDNSGDNEEKDDTDENQEKNTESLEKPVEQPLEEQQIETSEDADSETLGKSMSKDVENISLDLQEIDIGGYEDLGNDSSVSLKKPNEVFLEIYKEAKEKARVARRTAIQAYLEAKKIKKTYLLDNYIDSESDSESDFINDFEEELMEQVDNEHESDGESAKIGEGVSE
jgi:hypothetical protein